MDTSVEQVVDAIVAACESIAALPYDSEPVDQLQHADIDDLRAAARERVGGAVR
jgi:hypothetical protein